MSNSLNIDLKDRIVILEDGGQFLCEDGFGCSASTNGTKIFGKYLTSDGSIMYNGMINGYQIKSLKN